MISRNTIYEAALKTIDNLFPNQDFDLSVIVDDDSLLHELNLEYRGIDKPTDVLSFESHIIDPETGVENLGDILISYETAQKQAKEAEHAIEDEIRVLLIHGILHLSGYDHDNQQNKREMWDKQSELITIL